MKARLSEGYKPEFDIDLQYGRVGERLARDFLLGMLGSEPGHLTVEVKKDGKYIDTGRIYIEYQCKWPDGWRNSGLLISTADYWTFVVGETVVIGVPRAVLLRVLERARDPKLKYLREEKDGSRPTRGVAIPMHHFLTWLYMELHVADVAA